MLVARARPGPMQHEAVGVAQVLVRIQLRPLQPSTASASFSSDENSRGPPSSPECRTQSRPKGRTAMGHLGYREGQRRFEKASLSYVDVLVCAHDRVVQHSLLVVVVGTSLWQEVWPWGTWIVADIRAHHRAGWGGQGHAFEHVGVDHEERKAGARKAAAGHVLPFQHQRRHRSQRHVVELVEREVEASSPAQAKSQFWPGPVGWSSAHSAAALES